MADLPASAMLSYTRHAAYMAGAHAWLVQCYEETVRLRTSKHKIELNYCAGNVFIRADSARSKTTMPATVLRLRAEEALCYK